MNDKNHVDSPNLLLLEFIIPDHDSCLDGSMQHLTPSIENMNDSSDIFYVEQ